MTEWAINTAFNHLPVKAIKKQASETKGPLVFIKEVAKYFMDFLETDFHKRKNPKRSVQLRNRDNLLVGLNLGKYPEFNKLIWKIINQGFPEKILKIEKGVFRTSIPENLLELIDLQIKRITTKQVNQLLVNIGNALEEAAVLFKKESDKALLTSLEKSAKILRDDLVNPFIGSLEKPLENLNLGDENSIYLMEEELTSVLLSLLENKCSELTNLLISKEKVDVQKHLKDVFEADVVKGRILEFFEDFKVTDLFTELYEMERNRSILDKQDFYLYFCDITFRKAKYPIFYIPFSISRDKDLLIVEFDAQVYINKKALEFVVQEYNVEKEKHGNLKTIAERIIYLSQHEKDFRDLMGNVLSEVINFFELDASIDTTKNIQQASRSLWARVTNACSISLFDKSDEALVNDYEDILSLVDNEDNPLAGIFNRLIEDFIYKNPERFDEDIYDEWDDSEVGDKLVYPSPVPLNSEQRQILSAIQKDGCNYIAIEGPPGTGKSHTITAIVCNAILKNQSVLVLSDKKEALDVVEDKITHTMNKVRHDQNFQNPILRLGKTGSTYAQILSTSSVDNIRAHYRAVKKDYESLSGNIDKLSNTLKDDLAAEIYAGRDIDLKEIQELCALETYFEENGCALDLDEAKSKKESALDLEESRNICIKLKSFFKDKTATGLKMLSLFHLSVSDLKTLDEFVEFLNFLEAILKDTEKVRATYGAHLNILTHFHKIKDGTDTKLEGFINRYLQLRSGLFGYLFKKEAVNKLDAEFTREMNYTGNTPHQHLKEIGKMMEVCRYCLSLKSEFSASFSSKVDCLSVMHEFLTNSKTLELANEVVVLKDDLKYLTDQSYKYPETFHKLGIQVLSLESCINNSISDLPEEDFARAIRLITLNHKVVQNFSTFGKTDYVEQKGYIEDLVSAQMTYLMDERMIAFYYGNTATAKAIKALIQKKERFPKEEFIKLRQAFPCILAGIRDYAEYIPLEPDLFDLVIIDEASQVSIAQAFPALLRAKKVLILGDRKQFSNVKAAQARSDTNREFLNHLREVFIKNISKEETKLVKLNKFNIKTSILDFFEFIHNFNIQLKKHFRGYKEIIGYSNKHFYQESLEVMKIRGKPIDEVLVFSFIKHDGKAEVVPNSNTLEIDFIVSELRKLRDSGLKPSVGIITPHTNQQKKLMEIISKLPESDWYFDNLKLKIMTFDTCQGEERDIIFYSMVATKESDRLWGVFISDLSKQDLEEEGQIKAQRLNVGFSRARECMHFVLSKPLDDYSGSAGEALRHYYNALEEARKEKSVAEVDPSSPMEGQVMHWFYQTDFWNKNKETIDFRPQFELGKYLKQLDVTYSHPSYKVDFLLIYRDRTGEQHKIIIEYDGFKEHFGTSENINEFNYGEYFSEGDIYREKVLESYGYKFLRINKFNSGEDPVKTLDQRIRQLVSRSTNSNLLLDNIHQTVEGLQNGEMRECPKCKEIRERDEFEDPSLMKGYGRICRSCKSLSRTVQRQKIAAAKPPVILSDKLCPRCKSQMVLRTGRYGKFYGCKKFPYCKGTQPYSA